MKQFLCDNCNKPTEKGTIFQGEMKKYNILLYATVKSIKYNDLCLECFKKMLAHIDEWTKLTDLKKEKAHDQT